MISVVIPARNEPYLPRTVQDILEKAKHIEIIVVMDGDWRYVKDIPKADNVHIIHQPLKGMRTAINAGVSIAKGEYILKSDAHCMFDKGFDEKLLLDMRDNYVMIPTRKRPDAAKWELVNDGRDDIDYLYLDKDLRGRLWKERNSNKELKEKKIASIMSFQGSCYLIKKDYYEKLELLDDINFGGSGHEAQEIAFKVWKDGGKVVRNKNTWYAHYHKEGGSAKLNQDKSREFLKKWAKKNSPIKVRGFKRGDLIECYGEMELRNGAEIGVRTGRFSEHMCKSIKDINLKSIDPFDLVYEDTRSNKIGIKAQEKFLVNATKRLSPYKGCEVVRKLSMDAVRDVPYESMDFVYIDGSHEFDYVMCDIIEWARRIRKGGVVSGHDYFNFRNAGVVTAVDSYVKEHSIECWFLTDEKTPSWWWFK